MDKSFSDFLNEELKKRGWNQSDLARASGIKRQVVSSYINLKPKNPDPTILVSMAKGLHISPEIIFRVAGIFPTKHQISEKREKAHYAIDRVLEEHLDQLYDIIETFTKEKPPPPPQAPTKPISYPSRKKPARNVLKDK